MLRPTISKIAASKSAIPCPETAHVKMTLLKELPWVSAHSELADGAQSILLITRISGEEDPIALYISTRQHCHPWQQLILFGKVRNNRQ